MVAAERDDFGVGPVGFGGKGPEGGGIYGAREEACVPVFHLREGEAVVEGGDGEVAAVYYGGAAGEGVEGLAVVVVAALV